MGVKIRKIRGKWYVVIDYRGRRKTKCIGNSKKNAEDVRRQIEARLALNDMGVFGDSKPGSVTLSDYAEKWLREHGNNIKPATNRSYEQLLRLYVIPRFGRRLVTEIRREDVKTFLADLSDDQTHSRNTIRLIITALRAVLTAAVEDQIIESNPASKAGKFNKKEKGKAKAQAMTAEEALKFLSACEEMCPEYHAFFFTALRAGLRKGELIALRWGDIQFGESENDRNRFILMQRNCYRGQFGTPKNNEYLAST